MMLCLAILPSFHKIATGNSTLLGDTPENAITLPDQKDTYDPYAVLESGKSTQRGLLATDLATF